MGSNNGTGHPLTLRCAKCRVGTRHAGRGTNLTATGRTKERPRHGGARTTNRMVEIKCGDCGHIGWTIHSDAERLLRRLQTC